MPEPAGVGPCLFGSPLRTKNGVVSDAEKKTFELRPHFYNSAFPRMIVERVAPGQTVTVEGVRAEGTLRFKLPDGLPRTRLVFGDEVIDKPLAIDQIAIEADRDRVFVSYRYPFRYVVYPMQKRSCDLFMDATPVAAMGAR